MPRRNITASPNAGKETQLTSASFNAILSSSRDFKDKKAG